MSRSSHLLAWNDSEDSEITARHASPESFWELHRRLAECYLNDMRVHAPQDSPARNLLETAHAPTTPSPPAGSPHPLSPLAVSFPEMLKNKNKSASIASHVGLPSPCFSDRLTPERGEFGVPKVAPSPVRRRMSDSRDFGCASRGSSMVSASFSPRRCWLVKNKQPTSNRRKSMQAVTTTSSKVMDLPQTSNEYKDGTQKPFSLRSFHLNPTGNFRSFWDLLGLCFLVKDVIAIPLQLVNVNLQVFTTYNVVNALALVYWVVDIFLGFVTGLLHKGHLITDRRKICRHYLQTWFFIDVGVAVMDIVLEFGAVDDTVGESATTTRFLRFLRVMRVLRLGKLSQITQFFQDQFETQVASMEFSLIFVMLSMGLTEHVIACFWFGLGQSKSGGEETWISVSPYAEQGFMNQYLAALRWALAQQGMGNTEIEAISLREGIYTCGVAFISLLIFSTVISSMTSLVSAVHGKRMLEMQQMGILRRFLRQNNIPAGLSARITRFLQYTYHQVASESHSQPPILELLPRSLHAELQFACYESCMRKITFLKEIMPRRGSISAKQEQVVHKIATHAISLMHAAEDDLIFANGTEAEILFWPTQGSFRYLQTEQVLQVQEGQWISEMCLWCQWAHVGDFISDGFTKLVTIHADEFCKCVAKVVELQMQAHRHARTYVDALNCEDFLSDLWQFRNVLSVRSDADALQDEESRKKCCGWFPWREADNDLREPVTRSVRTMKISPG